MNKNIEDTVNSVLSSLKVLGIGNEDSEDLGLQENNEDSEDFGLQENDGEDSVDISSQLEKISFKDIYPDWEAEKPCEGDSEDLDIQRNDGAGSAVLFPEFQTNNEKGPEESEQQKIDEGGSADLLECQTKLVDLELIDRSDGGSSDAIEIESLENDHSYSEDVRPHDIREELQVSSDAFSLQVKLYDPRIPLLSFFRSQDNIDHLVVCYFLNKDVFMGTYFTICTAFNGKITQIFQKEMDLKYLKEMNISKLLALCDKQISCYKNLSYKIPLIGDHGIEYEIDWVLIQEITYHSISNATTSYYFRSSKRNLLYCITDLKEDGTTTEENIVDDDLQQTNEENCDVPNYNLNSSNEGKPDSGLDELIHWCAEIDLGAEHGSNSTKSSEKSTIVETEKDVDNVVKEIPQKVNDKTDEMHEDLATTDNESISDETQDIDPIATKVKEKIIDSLKSDEERKVEKQKRQEARAVYREFIAEALKEEMEEERRLLQNEEIEKEKELLKRKKESEESNSILELESKKIRNQ